MNRWFLKDRFMPLDLIQIFGNSYIVSGVNSVGVVINDKREAVLIDSGLNSAKDINKLLTKLGYTIVAVINTHHHVAPLNSISMSPQYLLCRMIIQAHVAYLEQIERIELRIYDSKLVVQAI